MYLKESNGQLKAYKTSSDIINQLKDFSEFQIFDQVANELRHNSNFLSRDYWYLVIGKETDVIAWEITTIKIFNGVPEIAIRGIIRFNNKLPVLDFEKLDT